MLIELIELIELSKKGTPICQRPNISVRIAKLPHFAVDLLLRAAPFVCSDIH